VLTVWLMEEGVCGTKTLEVTEIWRKLLHFIHNLYSSQKFFFSPKWRYSPSGSRPPHYHTHTHYSR